MVDPLRLIHPTFYSIEDSLFLPKQYLARLYYKNRRINAEYLPRTKDNVDALKI